MIETLSVEGTLKFRKLMFRLSAVLGAGTFYFLSVSSPLYSHRLIVSLTLLLCMHILIFTVLLIQPILPQALYSHCLCPMGVVGAVMIIMFVTMQY